MAQFIIDTINRLGYMAIVLLMFLENLFPPIPSELIMPFAGMAASRGGHLSFWWVVFWGTVGSLLGAVVLYWLGARIGSDRLRAWVDKHGHWLGFDAEDLDKSRQWFDRHGGATVLFCRMIPGVRSIISVPAGVDRMNFAGFLLYTTLGSAAWTLLLAWAGRLLGRNYAQVEKYLDPVTWLVLGGIALLWLYRVVKKQRGGCSRGRQPA
jgi:membrane protein DedA with SNARE-associated domain